MRGSLERFSLDDGGVPPKLKYTYTLDDRHRYPIPPQLALAPTPPNIPFPERQTTPLMAKHEETTHSSSSSPQPARNLKSSNSFHAVPNPTSDPRKTRTLRANTTPKTKILALQLSETPVISILLLPQKTPPNSMMTAYTAVNAHADWRVIATSVKLPACITLRCHASELDTRLLRVCVFGGRRTVGDFVIPVRTVLGRAAYIAVGKRSSLDVRGVVGSCNGWGLGVGLCAGMSVMRDVKGCLVRARRVGGGRADVGLGEWEFGREGCCRMSIVGEVLWFGIEQGCGNVVRLVFQVVKKGLLGGEQVVGEMQVGLNEIEKVSEGEILRVAWWRGGVSVVLWAMVEMRRQSIGQVLLELRLTR